MTVLDMTGRLDRFQRRHAGLAFPIAVAYKSFEDRALYLAALVSYYAFVSLFPLVLLFVTVVGFLVDGDPHLRQQLVHGALRHFPLLGPQLRTSISGFHGNAGALAAGVVGTLYGALGATQAAQASLNQIYGIPRNRQPNPLRARLRSLLLVLLFGVGVLLSTAAAVFTSAVAQALPAGGALTRVGGFILAFSLNVALFTAVLQLLTAKPLRIRNVITGGVIAGALFELLQALGSRYIGHQVSQGTSLYGAFGVVLAALTWIYLQSLVLMLAAEINVVLHQRLWPRALLAPFTDRVDLTEADRRVYASYAAAQQFKGCQVVSTSFDDHPPAGLQRVAGHASADTPR